jgi:hypothetical protein
MRNQIRQAASQKQMPILETVMRIKSTLCVAVLAGGAVLGVALTTQQAEALSVNQLAAAFTASTSAKPPMGSSSRGSIGSFRSFNSQRSHNRFNSHNSYRSYNGYGWHSGYRGYNSYHRYNSFHNYRSYNSYGWYSGYRGYYGYYSYYGYRSYYGYGWYSGYRGYYRPLTASPGGDMLVIVR